MTYQHLAINYGGTGRNYRQPLLEPHYIASLAASVAPGYVFLQYAKPEYNNTNVPWYEWQSRHMHVFGTEHPKPKGLALVWHGGGGDVGYAEHPEIMEKAVYLANQGYVACAVEYRRGWSDVGFKNDEANPDGMEVQRDLFNLTTDEYARQERSARMSFEDAQMALDYVVGKFPHAAKSGIIMEGTSFGGAIVLALTVMSKKAELYNFQGAVAGFGGVNAADVVANGNKLPSPTACPLVLIGGTADPIVPFWEGNYYCHGQLTGLGSAAVADLVRLGKGQAMLIGTTNKGHGYGVIDESANEQFDLLQQCIKDVKAKKSINQDVWFKALPQGKREPSTQAEALAGFDARCEFLTQ